MLCQNCGKNEANTHIKQIINGDMAESHLCSECASHLGYSDMFSGFGMDLSGFFGGLLSDMLPNHALGNVKRCEKCGCSFEDIARNGKVGCAECYNTFYDKLQPSIQRIHGKIKHSGKVSRGDGHSNTGRGDLQIDKNSEQASMETVDEKIAKLKLQMNEAVAKQEFEQAAKIRDEIKALEGGNNNE